MPEIPTGPANAPEPARSAPDVIKPIEVKSTFTETSFGKTAAGLFSGDNNSSDQTIAAFTKLGHDVNGLILKYATGEGSPAEAVMRGISGEYVKDKLPVGTALGIAEKGNSQGEQKWTKEEAIDFVNKLGSSGVITEEGVKALKEELNLQQPPTTTTS